MDDEYIDRMLAAVQSVVHNILDEPISEAAKEPTRDEYIDQLLAEMQTLEPVQSDVHNILDEPISEAVMERLLKPLLPRKYRPLPSPRKVKER